MKPEDTATILSKTDLFSALPPARLHDLVEATEIIHLEEDDILFEYGDIDISLYVILAGSVEVYRNDIVLMRLHSPEYIGELALMETKPRSASARAVEPTTLLKITEDKFDTYLRDDPQTMQAIIQTIASRLRRANDELNRSYQEINAIIHDSRNRLCSLGYVQLVAASLEKGSNAHTMLQHVNTTEKELASLLKQALNRARGITEDYPHQQACLSDVAFEVITHDIALHPDVQKITVSLDNNATIRPCSMNVQDIKRVIANLVINAAQASKPKDPITLHLHQDEHNTSLTVMDTGEGIPEEIGPYIFNHHFTTKETGNGIGLFSCKNIIEKYHHGTLHYTSVPTKGTSFTLSLPRI